MSHPNFVVLYYGQFIRSNAYEMSEHLFLCGEYPLPESAACASGYNEKKAKTFNKMIEIEVLGGK